MCNFYSYMQISTEEEWGLQKFTRQENALQRYAKENSIEYLNVAREQNLVAKTSLESTVKLLLIVELDRAEQERAITVQRIKDGIAASSKKVVDQKENLIK